MIILVLLEISHQTGVPFPEALMGVRKYVFVDTTLKDSVFPILSGEISLFPEIGGNL